MEVRLPPADPMQKTWIPEGTREYFAFKQVTQENRYLAKFIASTFRLRECDLVLDVGGRQGDIAYAIQHPSQVHIVDPDPTIVLTPPPGQFWRCRIQDADVLQSSYNLIICSHVLGYLSKNNDQWQVIDKLRNALAPGGSLVLFYNRNTGYMGELLKYSAEHFDEGHYDYFDENIFDKIPSAEFHISYSNVWFQAAYENLTELSRACWFLFGATNQDISGVAEIFHSKLLADKMPSQLAIEQRIVCIKKL